MLIFVAEEDYLTIATKNYYENLKRSGWKEIVELVDNEKEDHCFHLLDLDGDKAQEMRHKFVSFLKQDLAKFVLFDSDKAQEMKHRFSWFFEIPNRTKNDHPYHATTFYFLLLQVTKLPPTKVKNLDADR
jgi:hypothetical protein